MPHVSLIVEALRARPRAVFWVAILLQAAIWALLPALLYSSPPGDLPQTLAIGHAWQLGSWQGPPLAFWLAELAFRAAGSNAVGVYVLSQLAVVVAAWAIFQLTRAILTAQQATLAALLMTGIVALSLPTPEFGPMVLAIPLTALALLHFWRALGERRRTAWLALGIDVGLLLLTTYWGLLLSVLLAGFLLFTREGRRALVTFYPWAAIVLALLIASPHLLWLWQTDAWRGLLAGIARPELFPIRLAAWPLQIIGVIALHAGLLILAVLAGGWRADKSVPPPEIAAPMTSRLARRFVMVMALGLPLAATLVASLLDSGGTATWAAPFVLMSAPALVLAAGPRILLWRQHRVGVVWVAVLLLPPALLAAATLAAPWTGVWEIEEDQPAAEIGRFFGDVFRRRTGEPLAIVIGDSRFAYLTALAAPGRPHWASAAAPARSPWISDGDLRARGAIIVWDIEDGAGTPPAAVRERFPTLVAEVPQSFERPVQGMLPALRVGWGLLRPQPR